MPDSDQIISIDTTDLKISRIQSMEPVTPNPTSV